MIQLKVAIIEKIYDLFIYTKLLLMGLKRDVAKGENGVFYYEGGSALKGTIILIHGFADSKNGHLMVANKLLPNYRVLIPDLPGFGENDRVYEQKYTISCMSEKIIDLLREKKLEKVYLLGNSLGGAVAMDISSKVPNLVKGLILVGSAGFYNPNIRTVQNELLEGNYVFQVNSDHEFKELVKRVFARPPKIPSYILSYLSKEFQAQGEWYKKLLDDLTYGSTLDDTSDKLLEDSYNHKAKNFSMRTLLLWGEQDRMFPPEIAAFANTIIPNSVLKIIKNAGHAPQHDNLPDYIDELLMFLKEN